MARKTEEIEKLEEVENMEIEEAKKIKQEDAEKIKEEEMEKKMNEELKKIGRTFRKIAYTRQRLQELEEQRRMLMSTPAFDLRELARSLNVAWPEREE